MTSYYVHMDTDSNGDHEVHVEDCGYLPGVETRFYLGEFSSCKEAIGEAKKKYEQTNGCYCVMLAIRVKAIF